MTQNRDSWLDARDAARRGPTPGAAGSKRPGALNPPLLRPGTQAPIPRSSRQLTLTPSARAFSRWLHSSNLATLLKRT